MKRFKLGLVYCCVITSFFAGMSIRQEISKVPVVEISHVYDGDTIIANIVNWPEIIGDKIPIRIRGIDTPEMKDPSMKDLANKAKNFTTKMVTTSHVEIKNMTRDKFFRIDADIYVDGKNLGDLLIDQKLAKPYNGGKKIDWSEL